MRETKTVTITLTEECNLRCAYCYENNKSTKKIDVTLAKSIIDKELNNCSASTVMLEFFGGEPFLAFQEMKFLVEYVFSREWPVRIMCSTCTNGTLVHGEIQEWLMKNRDRFFVGLSIDGNREMHNINRSNSFDCIDLDFFTKYSPGLTIKMTISPETLKTLADGVIFLHEKGFEVACNLAYGIDWSSGDNLDALKRELEKLITYYLEHPHIQPCSMLSMSIENVSKSEVATVPKWCGCGTHMKAYDLNGNSYPCQFFLPLSMGKLKSEGSKELNILKDIPVDALGIKCLNCPFVRICPMCIGSNFKESGNPYMRNDNYCKYIRTIIYANSFFRWKQIKNGALKLSDEKLKRVLEGIIITQEFLKAC